MVFQTNDTTTLLQQLATSVKKKPVPQHTHTIFTAYNHHGDNSSSM